MKKSSHQLSLLISIAQVLAGTFLSWIAIGGSGTESFGQYLGVMSMLVIAASISHIGLPDILMREVGLARASGASGKEVLRLIFRAGSLLVPSPLIAGIAAYLIASLRADPGIWPVFLIILGLSISQCAAGLLRGLGAPLSGQIVILLLPPALMTAILAARTTYGLTGLFQAQLISLVCGLLIAGIIIAFLLSRMPDAGSKVSMPRTASLVRPALSLMLLGGLGVLNAQYDMVVLSGLAGPHDVVAFQLAVQAGLVFSVIRSNTGYMAAAPISAWVRDGRDEPLRSAVRPLIQSVIFSGAALYLLILVAIWPIAIAISGSELIAHDAMWIFAIAGGAYAVSAGFCVNGQIAIHIGKPWLMLRWSLTSLVINLVLAPLMAVLAGAVGISLSLAISVLIWNLGMRHDIIRETGLDLSPVDLLRGWCGRPGLNRDA